MLHSSHSLPQHHFQRERAWSNSSPASTVAAGHHWWLLARRSPTADAPLGVEAVDEYTRSPKHARLEAALFVAAGPLTLRKLMQFATLASVAEGRQLIRELDAMYEQSGSAFRIEKLATGYRLYTRPEFASWLDRIHHRQSRLKLSPPMMETLTIIAYRQPVTRADIEAVRGVQSAEIIKQLMERGLAKITGEDDSLGRPYLYGTTREFLEQFGIAGLDDLPLADTLRTTTPEPVAIDEPADEETLDDPDTDEDETDDDEEDDWDNEDDDDWDDDDTDDDDD